MLREEQTLEATTPSEETATLAEETAALAEERIPSISVDLAAAATSVMVATGSGRAARG